MFQGGFAGVSKCTTRDEFRQAVGSATRHLGFDSFTATVVIDHMPGEAEFITVDSSPGSPSGASEGLSARRADRWLQRCRGNPAPIVWGASQPNSRAATGRKRPRRARANGGICLALHLPQGRHFLFGVGSQDARSLAPDELTRVVADLQLMAIEAQCAAMQILLPAPIDANLPSLTPRELGVMRWTLEGRELVEVAALAGISERTAALHLTHAAEKLGCVNVHQALLKALKLGLLG